jgi:hypothetical protein
MASLASAEVSAGAVAKADQQLLLGDIIIGKKNHHHHTLRV